MPQFLIIFDEPSAEAEARLQEHYPDHYSYHSDAPVYLVRNDGISEQIAKTVGMSGDDKIVTGVVFKLNSAFSGYTNGAIWEWLQQSYDE